MSRKGETWFLVERAHQSPPLSGNTFGLGPCPMEGFMDRQRAEDSVGPGDHLYEVQLVQSWRGVAVKLVPCE